MDGILLRIAAQRRAHPLVFGPVDQWNKRYGSIFGTRSTLVTVLTFQETDDVDSNPKELFFHVVKNSDTEQARKMLELQADLIDASDTDGVRTTESSGLITAPF